MNRPDAPDGKAAGLRDLRAPPSPVAAPPERPSETPGQGQSFRREQFEMLLDRAPLGIYLVCEDFRLQVANPITREAFGPLSGEIIGHDFDEILRELWGEGAEEIARIFRHTLETGEPCHVPEYEERRADRGVTEYYDWRIERMLLHDGRFGVVCYFSDVSERVRSRLAIGESATRYATLLASIAQGYHVIEMLFDEDDEPVDFRFLETNAAAARETGLAYTVGRMAHDLLPELEGVWIERYARIARTGVAERFICRSGELDRWFEVDAFRIDRPELRRVAVLSRDITHRQGLEDSLRESEERLLFAKRAARLGIHDYSPMAGEIVWDERTREIWGIGSEEPITYELWLEGIHPDDRDRAEAAVRHALDPASDDPYFVEVRVISRADSTTRWVEVTGQPTFSEGVAVRLVGTVQDISEQKRSEESLKIAGRNKDEFLATLAHELRSPLAAIQGATGILQRHPFDAQGTTEMVTIVERQTTHLARLIEDLMNVSRITLGKVKLQKTRIDLGDIVRQVMGDSLATAEETGVEYSTALHWRPLAVEVDPVRFAQVLNNLLDNARKFTARGGEIRVTVERSGAEAVVRVADTGKGMTPDEIERIFDMFAQSDETHGRTWEGLGIGLSLAKSIVELHGGTLKATSAGLGRGSELTVRLPAIEEVAEIARPESPAEPGGPVPGVQPARRLRIVVAEDNADLLHVVEVMLRFKGHEVETAIDGTEALAKVREHRPDVALLDIGLPGMDGYEVARQIRREPWGKDLLLVAMTGWGQEKDKARAIRAGFDAHVTKPVDLNSLEVMLREGRKG